LDLLLHLAIFLIISLFSISSSLNPNLLYHETTMEVFFLNFYSFLHCTVQFRPRIYLHLKDHFGFEIGDNYQLATFTQTEAYFKKLASASPRAKYNVIGKTEEGRDQFMMIVTSPENHKKLDQYKSISQKLGNPEGITEEQAKALANEGKAVVWIDGGLHSTETVATHQLIATAYKLLTATDAETTRILDNVIILLVHANPDGQELVTNWYMRNPVPEKRSLQGVPKLYQKYVGHDNNRDFYMLNMKESQNIARQLFIEWIPPDHVQSSSDKSCRRRSSWSTLQRSFQLCDRSADHLRFGRNWCC
jgi:hypothetical protein